MEVAVEEKHVVEWSRKMVSILLKGYERRPYLYDSSLPEYRNKYLRQAGIQQISKALNGVPPIEIKRKFASLRSQCGKIQKAMKKAAVSAAEVGVAEIQKPKVWWWPLMHFMRHIVQPRTTESWDGPTDLSGGTPSAASSPSASMDYGMGFSGVTSFRAEDNESEVTPESNGQVKREPTEEEYEVKPSVEVLRGFSESWSDPPQTPPTSYCDYSDYWARMIADMVKKIPEPRRGRVQEKVLSLINDELESL